MLWPSEFSVGSIGDATAGLTLVMPRDRYEHAILVTFAPESPYAIFLSDDYQFEGFECGDNTNWNGILVPNVAIEIDERSAFNAERVYSSVGTLVRHGTQLDVVTQSSDGFRRPRKVPLITGLPPCRETSAAGFSKWRIVLGDGVLKRELLALESRDKPVN